MSGIYGFTYYKAPEETCHEAIAGLSHWNQIYGRESCDHVSLGDSAIGCFIEHFSDSFPYGGPVLEYRGQYAVIDALLFNRVELLSMLQLGADTVISDEELLLRLVLEKGFQILAQVNGDFAGALFDRESGQWRLFRDHLGVRPLYLYQDDRIFAFSTDMRGLLAVPDVKPGINENMLYSNLIGAMTITSVDTAYSRIVCARPAAVTTVQRTPDGFSIVESVYWKPRRKKIMLSSDEEYQARLRELITDAVNRRCDAIPGVLGAELSGGLDSSIIDILINRRGREAKYYSWSMDLKQIPLNPEGDERQVILDICDQEQIECRFKQPEDVQRVNETLDKIPPPFVNTQNLSFGSAWLRDQGVRVVFTGHAGDEGVSHRASRYELFYHGELYHYFRLYWGDFRGRSFRLLRTIRTGLIDAWNRFWDLRSPMKKSDYLHCVMDDRFATRMASNYRSTPVWFNTAPHKYVLQGGTRDRLDNAAYQGAYAGVRYLFPYVDYRVMDFALSVPRRLYLTPEGNRMLFRNAFRDMIPDSLYQVDYKDAPSLRPKSATIDRDPIFRQLFTDILKNLDPNLWSGILDFSRIEQLMDPQVNRKYKPARVYLLAHHLGTCTRIQKAQLEAKKWREYDAASKTL